MKLFAFVCALVIPAVALGQDTDVDRMWHRHKVEEWMDKDIQMKQQMMRNANNAVIMQQYAQQYANRCAELTAYAQSLHSQLKALEGQKKRLVADNKRLEARVKAKPAPVQLKEFTEEQKKQVGEWRRDSALMDGIRLRIKGKEWLEKTEQVLNMLFPSDVATIRVEPK